MSSSSKEGMLGELADLVPQGQGAEAMRGSVWVLNKL